MLLDTAHYWLWLDGNVFFLIYQYISIKIFIKILY